MELEFEGFYRRGFFVSKKRYAVIEDGTIIAKGLELVRRDWAPIAKQTQEDILMAILNEGNVKKTEKSFTAQITGIGTIVTRPSAVIPKIPRNTKPRIRR